jgi:hypothetical protein
VKTLILFASLLIICAPCVVADTYVKQLTHTDEFYYGGVVTPEESETEEMWIGENKMTFMNPNHLIIVNLEANSLIFANRTDSTYAETTLPLEWPNLLDEQAAARVMMFPRTGTLIETAETKTLHGKTCKCYEFASWIPYQGAKYDEREGKIWITTDAPFDASAYDSVREHFLMLQNYNEDYIREAVKVKGFPLLQESEIYMKGFSVNSYEKVVEITEKEPPADVYSVPQGFRKKDRLSMQDIRG